MSLLIFFIILLCIAPIVIYFVNRSLSRYKNIEREREEKNIEFQAYFDSLVKNKKPFPEDQKPISEKKPKAFKKSK